MSHSIEKARKQKVAKSTKMVQEGKFSLTLVESKAVNYLISKIKPTDDINTVYTFNCSEFQQIIHRSASANKLSYTNTKAILNDIGQKTWWITLESGKEAMVHWLNVVHMDPGSGDVEIKFHEDMFPFLYNLVTDKEKYYIAPRLEETSLMTHKYSPRIYDLLRSYQFNNKTWTFELGTGTDNDFMRKIADWEPDPNKKGKNVAKIPKSWSKFSFFERDVLAPAREEINHYTDIKIAYEALKTDSMGKKYRRPVRIKFLMLAKTSGELKETQSILDSEYNGNFDNIIDDTEPHQMTLEESFFGQNIMQQEKEEVVFTVDEVVEDAANAEELAEKRADETVYPIFYMATYKDFSEDQIDNLYHACIKNLKPGQIRVDAYDAWATDYMSHYFDWIKATPDDTKTTTYKRLLASLVNDYEQIAQKPTMWDKKG